MGEPSAAGSDSGGRVFLWVSLMLVARTDLPSASIRGNVVDPTNVFPPPVFQRENSTNVFAVSISKKKTVDRPKRKNETAQSIFLIESCTAIVAIRGWCGHL